MQRRIRTLSFLLAVVFACISATTVRADEVTDWNQIPFQAALTDNTLGVVLTRNAAIVQASVFRKAADLLRQPAASGYVPAIYSLGLEI